MNIKNTSEILDKLGIDHLNAMQIEARHAIHSSPEVVLLSPTGSGKTLAFLLPVIMEMEDLYNEIQSLILVPSRELAIQIEQVTREMGSGLKVNAIYGGRRITHDKSDLRHAPGILIGTPGRVADHIRRGTITPHTIKTLILDEYDKSLEVGFEEEMMEIMEALTGLEKKILTSATEEVDIPEFVGLKHPQYVNFLDVGIENLTIRTIVSSEKDKLPTLISALQHIGQVPGIIFCNFRDSIQRVSDFLSAHKIDHGCFHGGMEQRDRERSLIKFRNGSHHIIVATDLAARGIDIPEIKFILHYHLPHREEEFTHRNGRTARMHAHGTAYVLHWKGELLPEYMQDLKEEKLTRTTTFEKSDWQTLFISGGRKDKISKGDIAGMMLKLGQLQPHQLGLIELKKDCAFAAVQGQVVKQLIQKVNNTRLKKKKIRVSIV